MRSPTWDSTCHCHRIDHGAIFLLRAAVVVCFFTRDPRSTSISAKPHGRVNLAATALQLVLVTVFALGSIFGTTAQLAMCSVFAFINLFLHVWYLPYYKLVVNMVYVMHGCVFASATLFAIIALIRDEPQGNAEAISFLTTLPVVLFLGYSITHFRFESFMGPKLVTSPYLVEVRARRLLQELDLSGSKRHGYTITSAAGTGSGGMDRSNQDAVEKQLIVFKEVDDLYTRALAYFKDSAMVHVFAAQYYNIYKGNHRIEQMYLTEAEVRLLASLHGVP